MSRRPRAGEPDASVWFRLVDRDRRILELLAEHQVLTTSQITAVEFSSTRRAQDRMRQLRGLGVAFSFRDSYATGGTSEARFALGYVGARMMAARRAVTPPTAKEHTQRLERLALWPKLAHHIGVNDFFCRLAAYANPARPQLANAENAGVLTQWWPERRCSEFFWTHHGVKGETRIRPDGYGCWESGGRAVRFFLEYDTGTESLRVVARKISGYDGFPSDRFGVLLFSFHSTRRETAFRAGLVKMLGGYDTRVVVATTARDLPADDYPAGPVWVLWSARESGPAARRVRLADLPERGPQVRHHAPELPYGRAAFAPNDPAVLRLLSTDAA